MQKYIYVLLLFTGVTILTGCNHSTEENIGGSQTNLEDDDKTVNNNIDIYDFFYINKAPDAMVKHELRDLIKFYFSTNSPTSTKVAIDIENKEIYKKPRHTFYGVFTSKDPAPFNDKESLLVILEKFNVQEWREDYTTEDPDSYQDGAGWYLMLQFEDGTVERYRGEGSTIDIFPEEFDGFVEETDQLAKETLGEDYMKDSHSEP